VTRRDTTPKYHKQMTPQCARAFVELNGKRTYLGKWGSPQSKALYHTRLREWEAAGRRFPVDPSDLTIIELCEAFRTHAESYYRKPDGTPTGTKWNYAAAIHFLRELYEETPVSAFSPQCLKAVRHTMIRK